MESFLPTIHVLATKTRPKRLVLLGTDGRQYKYLLKAGVLYRCPLPWPGCWAFD